MESSKGWDFFDRIYCISVDDRIDRREQAKKEFARVGLLERVEFVLVARNPEDPARGIFQSHLLCLGRGLDAGAHRILVFEDDVFFRKFDQRILAEACSALDQIEGWEGLFLGCLTAGSSKTAARSLVGIKYRCLSHAYALSRDFALGIVREKWSGIPYDTLLRRRGRRFFAVYPMCAFQGDAKTDNRAMVIDRVRRLFGGLAFIQQMNEMYQNHKKAVLAAHLLILLILAVLVHRFW